MSILAERDPVFSSVLPSIERAYTLPQMVARNHSVSYGKNPNPSPKWVQELSENYFNGSPKNFYNTYFLK